MIFKYLLTLLLLFLSDHETALGPVMSTIEGDANSVECSDEYYWMPEHTYYTWEHCLFDYSGTIDDDPRLSREDHQKLLERVWGDFFGEDVEPPKLRRGQKAIEEVCGPYDDCTYPEGCFSYDWEWCGPWLSCLVANEIAVKHTGRRLLRARDSPRHPSHPGLAPLLGAGRLGAGHGDRGPHPPLPCLLLELYRAYTPDVADSAYNMLHAVCEATGWTLPD